MAYTFRGVAGCLIGFLQVICLLCLLTLVLWRIAHALRRIPVFPLVLGHSMSLVLEAQTPRFVDRLLKVRPKHIRQELFPGDPVAGYEANYCLPDSFLDTLWQLHIVLMLLQIDFVPKEFLDVSQLQLLIHWENLTMSRIRSMVSSVISMSSSNAFFLGCFAILVLAGKPESEFWAPHLYGDSWQPLHTRTGGRGRFGS